MQIKRVLVEEAALDYPMGERVHRHFKGLGTPVLVARRPSFPDLEGMEEPAAYREAKSTLYIGVRRVTRFEACKPSADFQLPLLSGCGGMCEYCYTHTRVGTRPYLRLYVNTEEIFNMADGYVQQRLPGKTTFELAASSDPLFFEPFSGMVSECVLHFARRETAFLRIATKFDCVDTLVGLEHSGHTSLRFSVNAHSVARRYEHALPDVELRIAAAGKVASAGYPTGFMIAPVFLYDGWQEDYLDVLRRIRQSVKDIPVTFEVIAHRFTPRAKESIQKIFPATTLDMDETARKFKFGQFGYGKYVYSKEQYDELKAFFREHITALFGPGALLYIV